MQYQEAVADCHLSLGNYYGSDLALLAKQPAKALEHYEQALALRTRLDQKYPGIVSYQRGLANVWNNLGSFYLGAKRFAEAEGNTSRPCGSAGSWPRPTRRGRLAGGSGRQPQQPGQRLRREEKKRKKKGRKGVRNLSSSGKVPDTFVSLDQETGLLVKSEHVEFDAIMMKDGNVEKFYSDFKDFDGLKQPQKVVVQRDGKPPRMQGQRDERPRVVGDPERTGWTGHAVARGAPVS